ncbi:MAG: hypothetical protein ACREHD_26780, partial [Pirellulales bacterium]
NVGRAAIAAGLDEWGRQLVDEAAHQVEKMGDGVTPHTRGWVAIDLADIDPSRAERIWNALPEAERQHFSVYAARLAAALAPRDLSAARRVAATQQWLRPQAMLAELARRLAPREPEKAIALVDELTDRTGLVKAEALASVAVVIAARDCDRACDLIDQALAMCRPEFFPTFGLINRSEHAARVAIAAAELGYPDMHSVVAQVLALRLTAQELARATIRAFPMTDTVRLLALVDRDAARDVVSHVARPADDTETRQGDEKLAEWLQAWALVDLAHSEELIRQIVAEQDAVLSREFAERALLPMIELVLAPWSDRDTLTFPEYRYLPSLPDD